MADLADMSQQSVDAEADAGQRAVADRLSRPGTQVCIGCGEEIDPARRKAAPWANRCLPCQVRADRWGRSPDL